jgi:hypothetical protein
MKRVTISCFLFLLLTSLTGDWHLLKKIPFTEVAAFTTDKLGNIYVVSENMLLQFDANGQPVNHYSEKNLGRLAYVDAVNPLKLLAFYPDFAQVNLLSSKLVLQSTILLRSMGIEQPLLVSTSAVDNGIWIYDRQDFQLKKIDLNLQVFRESGNIPQLTGREFFPVAMLEANDYLLISDPANGILFFDLFGTYFKTLPIKNVYSIQVKDNNLYYVAGGELHSYNFKTLADKKIDLPAGDSITACRFEQNRLLLLGGHEMRVYAN